MYDVYLIFRSVTHGQTAMSILERDRIPARLTRSPRELAPNGCAYALRIRSADAARAARLLTSDGNRPSAWYQRLQDGTFTRVSL